MKLRRKRTSMEDPHENTERWLLTYADLITLLLAFFIIMYSMSSIDAKQFGEVSAALKGALRGGTKPIPLPQDVTPDPTEENGVLKVGDLATLQAKIESSVEANGRMQDMRTELTERGLVVHVLESALFPEGSAELQPRAIQILEIINEQFRGIPNHVRIEGHTDDRPIRSTIYPTNWELSSARATSVVRYLIDTHEFPPNKISALGYGEYRPLQPNNSIENRSQNRRVDVVVLTPELSLKEPVPITLDPATP